MLLSIFLRLVEHQMNISQCRYWRTLQACADYAFGGVICGNMRITSNKSYRKNNDRRHRNKYCRVIVSLHFPGYSGSSGASWIHSYDYSKYSLIKVHTHPRRAGLLICNSKWFIAYVTIAKDRMLSRLDCTLILMARIITSRVMSFSVPSVFCTLWGSRWFCICWMSSAFAILEIFPMIVFTATPVSCGSESWCSFSVSRSCPFVICARNSLLSQLLHSSSASSQRRYSRRGEIRRYAYALRSSRAIFAVFSKLAASSEWPYIGQVEELFAMRARRNNGTSSKTQVLETSRRSKAKATTFWQMKIELVIMVLIESSHELLGAAVALHQSSRGGLCNAGNAEQRRQTQSWRNCTLKCKAKTT